MEDRRRQMLRKWLEKKQSELQAMVLGDDDASEWCRDEAHIVDEHIKTLDVLIHVNETLRSSTDGAHRQADLAYERIEELEAKLAKAMELANLVVEFSDRALWKVVKEVVLELKGEK